MAPDLAPPARQPNPDRSLPPDTPLAPHALVLAAKALVTLDPSENARTEQAVALGLEGAVVDGLGLFDLAVGPGQNLVGARDRNPNLVEDLSRDLRAEKIHKFLVHYILSVWSYRTTDNGGRTTDEFCVVTCTLSVLRRLSSVVRYSAASATPSPPRCCLELYRSTLRPSER